MGLPTKRALGLVLLALLAAAPSWARVEPRLRFHLGTPELHARLGVRQPRVGQNLETVAHYRRANGEVGGTAFLVSAPDERGVALALTNHHVALFDKQTVLGDTLLFHRGGARRPTRARALEVVAASQDLDFALIAVELPRGLRDLAPARLSIDGCRGVRRVYNAGFPRIWEAERERAAQHEPSCVAVTRRNAPVFWRALRSRTLLPKMVQVGRVNPEMWVEPFITLRLPNERGSSGSPIFAARDHRVIGMLTAGGGGSDAFAMPLGVILREIATQRRQGRGDPALGRAVERMLRETGVVESGGQAR